MSNASKFRKKAVEFEQLKQFDRAVASYVRAIEENENAGEEVDVALFNKVGDLTLRGGRVTEAVTYYERAVEHYVSNNLFDNAIALCNKILRNAPGRSNVYFTLGRICGRKGLRSDATRNFLEYATRMQQEGRVDEGMRALAEVADLMPELTEVGRLVEEHAARAGITLAPRRRATPPRTNAQPEVNEATRNFGMSKDLVFLQIDYEAAQQARAKTPPPQRNVVITAESAVLENANASASNASTPNAQVAVASLVSAVEATTTPVTTVPVIAAPSQTSSATRTPQQAVRTARLEDLMIFDPSESTAAHVDVLGDDATSVVDGASILKPYADITAPVDTLNDLEPTELKSPAVADDEHSVVSVVAVETSESVAPIELEDERGLPTPVAAALVVTQPEAPAVAFDETFIHEDVSEVDDNAGIFGNVSIGDRVGAATPVSNDVAALTLEESVASDLEGLEVSDDVAVDLAEAEVAFVADETLADASTELSVVDEPAAANDVVDLAAVDEIAAEQTFEEVAAIADNVVDAPPSEITPVDDAAPDVLWADELPIIAIEAGEVIVEANSTDDFRFETPVHEEAIAELPAIETIELQAVETTSIELMDSIDRGAETETDASASTRGDDSDIVNFAVEQELNLIAPAPHLDGFTPDEEPVGSQVLSVLDVTADDLIVEAEADVAQPLAVTSPDLLPSLDFDAMLDSAMLDVDSDVVEPVADLQAEEFEPVNNELAASRFTRIESEALPRLPDEFDAECELPPLTFPETEPEVSTVVLDFIDIDVVPPPAQSDLIDIDLELPVAQPELIDIEFDGDILDDLFIDTDVPTAVAAAEATLVASSRCAELQSASDAEPSNYLLRRRLAEALFESGNREAAIGELGTALALAEQAGSLPDAADMADELVRVAADQVAHHQKRLELAIRIGDQVRLREAYLDFADALVRQGEEIRARAVYARVLEIDPWDDRARTALGDSAPPPPAKPATAGSDESHVNLADWLRDEDEPASTRLRMREPDISGDEQDDFNALLRHFKEGVARSLGEDDYESHYDLGVAYKEMGLLDDAIGEFQMALRSRNNRLAAYEALGQCFLEQQSYKVAVTVLSRALHEPAIEDEQRVGVLYLLGYSCEALQRFDEARGYFQRVYATDIHFRDVAQRLAALDRTVR